MNSDNPQESSLNKTIIRSPHDRENPYVMIRRAVPQDERLSWEARGIIAYLLSKPENWIIQANDLRQNCGRDKVYSILKELTENGYLERVQYIDEKSGQFDSFEYHLHETPLTPLPDTANPHHIYNRDSIQNKDSSEPTVQGETVDPIQFPERRSPFSENKYEGPRSPNAKGKGKRIMGRESVVEGYEPGNSRVNSAMNKPAAAPDRPQIVPKPAKSSRPRDIVLDAIGLYIFDLDTNEKIAAMVGRLVKFKKALREYLGEMIINNPAGVVQLLEHWAKWYVWKYPGYNKPTSEAESFMNSYFEGEKVNFSTTNGAQTDMNMVEDPDNPGVHIHKDLLAQRQEADAAFKARYGDKS